ncbi:uncharacterized protein H6S33_006585 [Morchella sextelata]|uniref:uncharacterized protein n=1 Tax=Morchella sextelata TaxID=1174677 RepID=UPI001D04C08B|nr:uncharacterized protein H6S33_006585 [Morchella sextelata]KAH0604917.1 hypothetical protein H6S33_006585 [Morchella sextelata]
MSASASSRITQGVALSFCRAFHDPIVYRICHRKCTQLALSSALGALNLPAPSRDMTYVRRRFTNTLLTWTKMRVPTSLEMLE